MLKNVADLIYNVDKTRITYVKKDDRRRIIGVEKR